jgi:hypothetical protein
MPGESTRLRTLRLVDVAALETMVLANLAAPQSPRQAAAGTVVTPPGTRVQALAVDGKTLRGATAHGAPTHRVSLVRHGSGTTLAQVATGEQRHEPSAIPPQLTDRNLHDTIATSDDRHRQHKFARAILNGGGDDLMIAQDRSADVARHPGPVLRSACHHRPLRAVGPRRDGQHGPRTAGSAPGIHHRRLPLHRVARGTRGHVPDV